jgi:hypothetical protein
VPQAHPAKAAISIIAMHGVRGENKAFDAVISLLLPLLFHVSHEKLEENRFEGRVGARAIYLVTQTYIRICVHVLRPIAGTIEIR